jgi:hypothetical protein
MNRPAFHATRDVVLQVEDMARALKFYGETEQGKRPGPVFEFLVPELQAAGCQVVEEDPELPRLYLRDPYGLTFNLSQR